MNIQDYDQKLTELNNTKNDIKQAIIDKGISVSESDTFRSYVTKINKIKTGQPAGYIKFMPYSTWRKMYPAGSNYGNYEINLASQIEYLDCVNLSQLEKTDFSYFFSNWPALNTIFNGLEIRNWNSSNVTNMSHMFENSILFKDNIVPFDTSNVIDMSYMFYNVKFYPQAKEQPNGDWTNLPATERDVNFSNLNSNSLINASHMFEKVEFPHNIIWGPNFTCNKVEDMSYMFSNTKVKVLDLSYFNTPNLKNMYRMFDGRYNNSSTNANFTVTTINMSNFNTSAVTNMTEMFRGLTNIQNIIWGPNWGANSALKEIDICNKGDSRYLTKESVLDLFNKLAIRNNNPTIKVWQGVCDTLTDKEMEIATNKGWTIIRSGY